MAEESERRFHAAMDKLFHAPTPPNSKSKSSRTTDSTSLSGGGLPGGNKRPHPMTTALALVPKSKGGMVEELRNSSGGTVETPMCRPWDRGDLLKRLATFKSMTWFAKPEVVNAVNCARRGWVNVDMDTIGCESCGARLLFSTPSSWQQQQVEKAALVFSLKLNSGHKLLCPWVDNACDEKLAQFPPSSVADLVDNYKKRCASLLQLVALPVISPSSIDYMRSPQLEHFLKGTSTVEHVNKSDNVPATEYHGDECEEIFSILYYQAQKLISLCGWEPRLLPYIVDCKHLHDQSAGDGALADASFASSGAQAPSISVYSSGTAENMDGNEDSATHIEQYDPTSVVLDCRLCGATVGLWAFSTTPRPVEYIRFIGHSSVNDENRAADKMRNTGHKSVGPSESGQETASTAKTDTTSSNKKLLNLTIAGGPPPAEQNFRPKISLPVVGQNLRTRFSSAFESRHDDHRQFRALSQGNNEHTSDPLSSQSFQPEDMRSIEGKMHEDALRSPMSNQAVVAVGDYNGGQVLSEGAAVMETEIPMTSKPYSTNGNQLESTDIGEQSSSAGGKSSENLASTGTPDVVAGDPSSSEVGGISLTTHDSEHSSVNHVTSLNEASQKDVPADKNPGSSTICHKQVTVQPMNSGPSYLGKDIKQLSAAKAMEFDPIMQHRHFCPWIASSGKSTPGWKQTLSALERQKDFFCPSPTKQASSSLFEVDDPIGSVKKLLTPPSAKRKKLTHGSS